jgi:TonB-linked SusC/RagA family outer membrane protein
MIVITTKTDKPGNDPPEKIDVKGQVVNEKGEPAPGISVTIKNSRIGTMTDEDGRFELVNTDESAILVFSGANIETREEPLNQRKDLVVVVKSKINRLDDVQIIGYGTTTKRFNTGTVTTITSEEISRQPVDNLLKAMEGRVPGMYIQSNSGFTGSNFNIQIRGIGSIAAGTNPLFIIDGVPFNSNSMDLISSSSLTAVTSVGNLSPLNSINPTDIESIEILRDADATAIYGSRAANGVVLITTKKGKSEKTTFSTSLYTGIGQIAHFIPMLDIKDYLKLRHMAYANDGISPTRSDAPDLLVWDTTQNTDWQKKLLGGTAKISDIHGSLSGGNDHARILLSGNVHSETTVFPSNAGDHRISGHLQAENSTKDNRFSTSISINYSLDHNTLVSDPTPYLNLPPDYPVSQPSDKIIWRPSVYTEPLAQINIPFHTNTHVLLASSSLNYSFPIGITLKLSSGYTQTDMDQSQLFPSTVISPLFGTPPYAYFSENHLTTWITEPQITYQLKLGSATLNMLAGTTIQQTRNSGQLISAENYSNDGQLANISAAGHLSVLSSNAFDYRYVSGFLRATYNDRGKYIVNATFRRDGSSRFGSDHQFGNFGSLGAAWIFSEERFIKNNIHVMSFGKLRGSFGVTGNDQVADYEYLSSYTSTIFPYQVPGLRPQRISNNKFGWESTWKWEGSLELGFWQDRLLLSGSFYKNHSGNQLVNLPLPSQTGFLSYLGNLPAVVENTGAEFTIQAYLLKTASWKWKLYSNLTIPKNKLVKFPFIENTGYGATYLVVGKPLNLVWGTHYLGTDKQLGTSNIADLDKDGVIGGYPGDYTDFANTMPTYYGGIGQTLTWKNWTLDFLFQFVKKLGVKLSYGIPGSINNQPVDVYNNLWKRPGDEAQIPKASTSSYDYYNYRYSDAGYYDDASYIKLKNISLSYNFHSSSLGTRSIRLYVMGQNIFAISHYLGFDPEAMGPTLLPNLRILTIGIHAEF